MCRINLKKIEARRPVQDLKAEFKFDDALLPTPTNLDQLVSQPGQPLFEEPLFNPLLLTPVSLATLSADCFPFPDIDQLSSVGDLTFPPPPTSSQPAYQDLLASHSLGLEQPSAHFYPSSEPSPFSVPPSPASDESGYRSDEASPHKQAFFPSSSAAAAFPPAQAPLLCSADDEDYISQPNSKKRTARNPTITEDKRERNRLAAEKYRRKGRELICTLEKRCGELSRDNNDLRQRNHQLEEEIQYLRSLLTPNVHNTR